MHCRRRLFVLPLPLLWRAMAMANGGGDGGEMYKFAEQNFKLRVLPDENYNQHQLKDN